MRICFLGPSSYGKSTSVKILSNNYQIINLKIAEPLYELQEIFYHKIETSLKGEQDGELLQFYGIKIRKENPTYLEENFKNRLACVNNNIDIITNDDCRPYDYQYLKDLEFIFIKINGYKRNRGDHSEANPNLITEWQSDIPYDYTLDNLGTLEDYETNILSLVKELKNDRKVLHYTSSKKM